MTDFSQIFNSLIPGGINTAKKVDTDLNDKDIYFKEEAKSKEIDIIDEVMKINDEKAPWLNDVLFGDKKMTEVASQEQEEDNDIELNELNLDDIIPDDKKEEADVWELSNIEIKDKKKKSKLEEDFEDKEEPLDNYIYESHSDTDNSVINIVEESSVKNNETLEVAEYDGEVVAFFDAPKKDYMKELEELAKNEEIKHLVEKVISSAKPEIEDKTDYTKEQMKLMKKTLNKII